MDTHNKQILLHSISLEDEMIIALVEDLKATERFLVIPREKREKISRILDRMKIDSERHKKMIQGLLRSEK